MPRGNMPRQPSRSGRQDRARSAKAVASTAVPKRSRSRNPSKPASARQAKPASGKTAELGARKTGAKSTQAADPLSHDARNHNPLNPERVQLIVAGLDQMYPGVTCALAHKTAWELLVSTILSAQSTDVRVNLVTPALFAKYPNIEVFAALEPEQLQPDIYSS